MRQLFAVLAVCAVVMVFGGFSFSSLDAWRPQLAMPQPSSVVVGKARGIRSAEWLVPTPAVLSQLRIRMATTNRSLGCGTAPLLVMIAAMHWSMAVQRR